MSALQKKGDYKMKHYKDYDKNYIGESDIARLILSYPGGVQALNFGEDGEYYAYIIDGDTIIGDHYKKVLQASTWLEIYDDTGLIRKFKGNRINIYRAGDFGCIIQIIEAADNGNFIHCATLAPNGIMDIDGNAIEWAWIESNKCDYSNEWNGDILGYVNNALESDYDILNQYPGAIHNLPENAVVVGMNGTPKEIYFVKEA